MNKNTSVQNDGKFWNDFIKTYPSTFLRGRKVAKETCSVKEFAKKSLYFAKIN